MIPILKVVERLQAHEAEAAEKIGTGFALVAMEAALSLKIHPVILSLSGSSRGRILNDGKRY